MSRNRSWFCILALTVPVWSTGCSDSSAELSTVKSIVMSRGVSFERLLGTGDLQTDSELWVISQLQHRDFEIRWKACMVLGNTSSKAAATTLYLVAKADPDHKVRWASRYALSNMGGLGRRFLVYLLRSGDRDRFTIAAYAKTCKADLRPFSPGLDFTVEFDTVYSLSWWDKKGRVILENEEFEDMICTSPPTTGPAVRIEDTPFWPKMPKKE